MYFISQQINTNFAQSRKTTMGSFLLELLTQTKFLIAGGSTLWFKNSYKQKEKKIKEKTAILPALHSQSRLRSRPHGSSCCHPCRSDELIPAAFSKPHSTAPQNKSQPRNPLRTKETRLRKQRPHVEKERDGEIKSFNHLNSTDRTGK